jgi:hypothetical protein
MATYSASFYAPKPVWRIAINRIGEIIDDAKKSGEISTDIGGTGYEIKFLSSPRNNIRVNLIRDYLIYLEREFDKDSRNMTFLKRISKADVEMSLRMEENLGWY